MLKSVTLYTALLLTANAAAAEPALEALRQGDMKELAVHEAARDVPGTVLVDLDGTELTLADFAGEPVVLNLWATWCGPCREEMPSLDRLQAQMGDRIEVVTVATGRQSADGIRRFFDQVGAENLPTLTDPKGALAEGLAVTGLPATILLDAEGREVARLSGPAEWDGPAARAILVALADAAEG